MARVLAFDYDAALDRAMRLFWKSGYLGTSLRDLLKAMGIGEGSFYNTLKNKKHAYLECLKHYNATINRSKGEAFFSAPTTSLGLRAFFNTILDCLDDPKTPSRVCMMAGGMTSEVLDEPDLRAYMEAQLSKLEVMIRSRLVADKEVGSLPSDFDDQAVTAVIMTYIQGLWRMALISYERSRFEKQIDLFLTGLGL